MDLRGGTKRKQMLDKAGLTIDCPTEVVRVVSFLNATVSGHLRRAGVIVALDGNCNSAVVLALCLRAFGRDRVSGLIVTEKAADPETTAVARRIGDHYQSRTTVHDLTPVLEVLGLYERYQAVLSRYIPEYGPGWRASVTVSGSQSRRGHYNAHQVMLIAPSSEVIQKTVPLFDYATLIAVANLKERLRSAMLYYYAELNDFAVIGSASKNDYELACSARHSAGSTDIQPIAHLYQTQVRELAAYLQVPEEVQAAELPPEPWRSYAGRPDEDEVSAELCDVTWAAYNQGIPDAEIGSALGLTTAQIDRIITDTIRRQRATTEQCRPAIRVER
jgi:NAD+ synthase